MKPALLFRDIAGVFFPLPALACFVGLIDIDCGPRESKSVLVRDKESFPEDQLRDTSLMECRSRHRSGPLNHPRKHMFLILVAFQ